MREVKEKSSLKARAVETLKSAPQAAFRRGADASFQQLRQELREAAQDGKSDDRYESGKITDTADHAVQEARHLAEKAVHKLPKTKSEPQREARTESVPQHEQPRHPLQPTAAPREYPPQSQSQGNQSVRESASPIREKPVSPVNVRQPKTREYTQMRKHQCPRLSIQLRGFMKTQRLFLRKQCHRQWNILRVNRFLRLRRNRLLLQILRNPKCGSKHRMRKRQRLHLGIQFRGFAKTQRLLLRKL